MSDNDMIRRGDALAIVQEWTYCCDAEDAIAALPAVTIQQITAEVAKAVPAHDAAIREAALREVADLLFTLAGEKGGTKTPQGRTAQYYARRILALIQKGTEK